MVDLTSFSINDVAVEVCEGDERAMQVAEVGVGLERGVHLPDEGSASYYIETAVIRLRFYCVAEDWSSGLDLLTTNESGQQANPMIFILCQWPKALRRPTAWDNAPQATSTCIIWWLEP